MPTHDYSARDALELILRKIAERDKDLGAEVRRAIDEGKVVELQQESTDRRRRPHRYRKTVPYTPEEALRVTLNVLNAYFVEQPLLANSALANFFPPTSAEDTSPRSNDRLEIEAQTETKVLPEGQETVPIVRIDPTQIDEQRHLLANLGNLLTFDRD